MKKKDEKVENKIDEMELAVEEGLDEEISDNEDRLNRRNSRKIKKLNRKNRVKYSEKPARRREPVISGFMGRLIIVLAMILAIMIAAKFMFFNGDRVNRRVSASILLDQKLEACRELVVTKYKYRDVVVPTASYGLSKSYAIIRFDGVIRIGIRDITQSDIEVYNNGKGVRIRLPFIEVLGNDIAEQEVIDELKSIFAPTTHSQVIDEINSRKDQVLQELIDENIYEEARKNAVSVVEQMVQAMGFEEYEIDCKIEEYLKPLPKFELPEEELKTDSQ